MDISCEIYQSLDDAFESLNATFFKYFFNSCFFTKVFFYFLMIDAFLKLKNTLSEQLQVHNAVNIIGKNSDC